MSATHNVVQALKRTNFSQLWFCWLHALGDFLVLWCSVENSWQSLAVKTLAPPAPCVAILPDDMMAVEELHMTLEGMDLESMCVQCKPKGVGAIQTGTFASVVRKSFASSAIFLPQLPFRKRPKLIWRKSLRVGYQGLEEHEENNPKIPPNSALFYVVRLILRI